MGHLILIRGIPGSGKTTLAREIASAFNCEHVEADQFFETGGEYKYDASLIKEAHSWCFNKTKEHLARGANVIVSNTFVKLWEMQKYLDIKSDAIILTARGNYKNIHNVPDSVVQRMKDNWEESK